LISAAIQISLCVAVSTGSLMDHHGQPNQVRQKHRHQGMKNISWHKNLAVKSKTWQLQSTKLESLCEAEDTERTRVGYASIDLAVNAFSRLTRFFAGETLATKPLLPKEFRC